MNKVILLFALYFIINPTIYSQIIPRSYHPQDPSIDGSFIIDGELKAHTNGKYIQNSNSLVIYDSTEVTVKESWVWDIVHKPSGIGKYSLYLAAGKIKFNLADIQVNGEDVTLLKLHNGTKVATSVFWPENSVISKWNIGKYLAIIVPISNIYIPKCAKLVIELDKSISIDFITIVTQKPTTCNITPLCFESPRVLASMRYLKDEIVLVKRFPYVSLKPALQYLNAIITSKHAVDIYDTYAISMQYSMFFYLLGDRVSAYNTSATVYNDYNKGIFLPDYTLNSILTSYLNAYPNSSTHLFFGNIIKNIVVNSDDLYCKSYSGEYQIVNF